MGEEGIKSALEIAMEKISGLAELTPEEIARQKEREYMPIGEALCKRYLDGAIIDKHLAIELSKYPADQGRIVRRALVSCLCRSIQLEDEPKANKALQGFLCFLASENRALGGVAKDYQRILDEFEKDRQGKYPEFESLSTERLRKLGISGSAVSLNPNEDKSWQAELGRIRNAYEPQLAALRKILMQEAQGE